MPGEGATDQSGSQSRGSLLLEVARRSVAPVCGGLGLYYLAVSGGHQLLVEGDAKLPMTLLAVGSGILLLAGRQFRRRLGADVAPNALLFGAGLLVLANATAHLYLTRNLEQSTNFALAFVGAGLFLVDARFLAGYLGAGAMCWWFASRHAYGNPAWIHYGFMLMAAAVLAGICWKVRLRSLFALERAGELLRIEEEKRRMADELAQAQRLESQVRIAGWIGHQFNEVLAVVLGNASFLLTGNASGGLQRQLTEDIMQAAEQAAGLTGEILAFAGKGEFRREEVDLGRLVGSMAPLLRAALPKTVKVRYEPPGCAMRIEADPGLIRQIVMNLAKNAADAIGAGNAGTVSLRVKRGPTAKNVRWLIGPPHGAPVLLEAEDTGGTLDEAKLQESLELFADPEGERRTRALAVVAGAARGHGAAFGLSAGAGTGSCFVLAFPGLAEARHAAETAGLAERIEVLVVDDEPLIRKLVRRVLDGAGYDVVEAASGTQAAALVLPEPGRFGLLILDLRLGDMGGVELLCNLRVLGCEAPVVFSSGDLDVKLTEDYLAGNRAVFLPKPYRHGALLEMVRQQVRSGA